MIQKQIANWLVEFDHVATKAAYAALPLDMGCTCQICRNYCAYIPNLSDGVRNFFEDFGIDTAKPSEVYENVFEDDKVLYGGFYHLVGNYLSGDDIWKPIAKKHKYPQITEFYKITDDFKIGFTENISLVPKEFPRPVIQMEISFTIPWVLKNLCSLKMP